MTISSKKENIKIRCYYESTGNFIAFLLIFIVEFFGISTLYHQDCTFCTFINAIYLLYLNICIAKILLRGSLIVTERRVSFIQNKSRI